MLHKQLARHTTIGILSSNILVSVIYYPWSSSTKHTSTQADYLNGTFPDLTNLFLSESTVVLDTLTRILILFLCFGIILVIFRPNLFAVLGGVGITLIIITAMAILNPQILALWMIPLTFGINYACLTLLKK